MDVEKLKSIVRPYGHPIKGLVLEAADEIAHLRQQVATLTEQRDTAVDALSELYDIVQGVIDDGKAPKGLIDSFTLQPARHALATIQSSKSEVTG